MEMSSVSQPQTPTENGHAPRFTDPFEDNCENGEIPRFIRSTDDVTLHHQRSFNRVKFILDSGRPDNVTGDYDDIKMEKNERDRNVGGDRGKGSSDKEDGNGLSKSGRKCLLFAAGLLVLTMAVILGSLFGSRRLSNYPAKGIHSLTDDKYIRNAVEGRFKITNLDFTDELENYESDEFKKLSKYLESLIFKVIYHESGGTSQGNSTVNVKIIKFVHGSIIPTFRIQWATKDLLGDEEIRKRILRYLDKFGSMDEYKVDKASVTVSVLLNNCHEDVSTCSHTCIFDQPNLRFVCRCPDSQVLKDDNVNCTTPQQAESKPVVFHPNVIKILKLNDTQLISIQTLKNVKQPEEPSSSTTSEASTTTTKVENISSPKVVSNKTLTTEKPKSTSEKTALKKPVDDSEQKKTQPKEKEQKETIEKESDIKEKGDAEEKDKVPDHKEDTIGNQTVKSKVKVDSISQPATHSSKDTTNLSVTSNDVSSTLESTILQNKTDGLTKETLINDTVSKEDTTSKNTSTVQLTDETVSTSNNTGVGESATESSNSSIPEKVSVPKKIDDQSEEKNTVTSSTTKDSEVESGENISSTERSVTPVIDTNLKSTDTQIKDISDAVANTTEKPQPDRQNINKTSTNDDSKVESSPDENVESNDAITKVNLNMAVNGSTNATGATVLDKQQHKLNQSSLSGSENSSLINSLPKSSENTGHVSSQNTTHNETTNLTNLEGTNKAMVNTSKSHDIGDIDVNKLHVTNISALNISTAEPSQPENLTSVLPKLPTASNTPPLLSTFKTTPRPGLANASITSIPSNQSDQRIPLAVIVDVINDLSSGSVPGSSMKTNDKLPSDDSQLLAATNSSISTSNKTTEESTTIVPRKLCSDDEFQCATGISRFYGKCIPKASRCDSVYDCHDQSDEDQCLENKCFGNYPCWSGDCIQRKFVCDGIRHCKGGGDEEGCGTWKCTDEEFRCNTPGKTGRVCIALIEECDGQPDCTNHTDEMGCATECSSDQFFCPEGWCIPNTWTCDGQPDCSGGEDELDCDCAGLDQSKCVVGGCVPTFKLCDGLRQCPDGSDEYGCLRIDNKTKQLEVRSEERRWSAVCGDKWTAGWTELVCEQLGLGEAFSTEVRRVNEPVPKPRVKLSPDAPKSAQRGRAPLQYFLMSGECSTNPLVHISCKQPTCGIWPKGNAISSNSKIRDSVWPSLGLLIQPGSYDDLNQAFGHSCAATIITPAWVIASYSCLLSKPNGLDADKWAFLIGESSPRAGQRNTQHRHTKQVVVYPGAKRKNGLWVGDAVLLRLQTAVVLDESTQMACLPDKPANSHSHCAIASWIENKKGEEGGLIQNVQNLPVPNLTVNTCNISYYEGKLETNHVCASFLQDSHSPCNGKEGSPLMCKDKDGSWHLHGLLSITSTCARFELPSLFTDISSIHQWILNTVEKATTNSITSPKTTTRSASAPPAPKEAKSLDHPVPAGTAVDLTSSSASVASSDKSDNVKPSSKPR